MYINCAVYFWCSLTIAWMLTVSFGIASYSTFLIRSVWPLRSCGAVYLCFMCYISVLWLVCSGHHHLWWWWWGEPCSMWVGCRSISNITLRFLLSSLVMRQCGCLYISTALRFFFICSNVMLCPTVLTNNVKECSQHPDSHLHWMYP